jgi:hypothetical protein
MFLELIDAAAASYQSDEKRCAPEEFAKDCVETVLADRRLARIAACS